jgi:hypothetical protein
MAQTQEIERIIRREKKDFFPKRASEKRIIIDVETGRVVGRETFWRSYAYYIVSNSSGTRDADFTSSAFPVIDKDRKISISINCQVSCEPGEESMVAEALHRPDQRPGPVLDDLVEIWVSAFVKQHGQTHFIDTFFQNRGNLEAFLATRAKAQTGLTFEAVRCVLEGESKLETIHISLEDVPLRYSDSVSEHPFSADVSLLVDPGNKINAIARARTESQFKEIITRHLREYFFNHVSLAGLYENREAIEDKFKAHLETLMRPYGRRIGAILVKKTVDWGEFLTLKKTVSVKIEVPEYPDPVSVVNHVLIKKVDPARYDANKSGDLEVWVEKTVQRVVTDVYFGLHYYEIIKKEKELRDSVESTLKSLVEMIGYKLDHFILIPALKEIDALEKIEVNIDNEFLTRDQQAVKLKIFLKARGDWSRPKIRPFINDISVLPSEMESLISQEVTNYVRTIQSQDFYEKFDDQENGKKTVRAQLDELIREKLKKAFDTETLFLSFDMGETRLIEMIDQLKKEAHDFEVKINSLFDGGSNSFTGSFQVRGPAPGFWNIIQTQEFGIEDIRKRIIKALTAELNAFQSVKLAYTTPENRKKIIEGIERIAKESVKHSFGLTIAVWNIYRTNRSDDDFAKMVQGLRKSMWEAVAEGDNEYAEKLSRRIDRLMELEGFNQRSLPAAAEAPMIEATPEDKNGDGNAT